VPFAALVEAIEKRMPFRLHGGARVAGATIRP
jgi:hypothetical protein